MDPDIDGHRIRGCEHRYEHTDPNGNACIHWKEEIRDVCRDVPPIRDVLNALDLNGNLDCDIIVSGPGIEDLKKVDIGRVWDQFVVHGCFGDVRRDGVHLVHHDLEFEVLEEVEIVLVGDSDHEWQGGRWYSLLDENDDTQDDGLSRIHHTDIAPCREDDGDPIRLLLRVQPEVIARGRIVPYSNSVVHEFSGIPRSDFVRCNERDILGEIPLLRGEPGIERNIIRDPVPSSIRIQCRMVGA